jgi:hypothetical protein
MRPCMRCAGPLMSEGSELVCLHCGHRPFGLRETFYDRLADAVLRLEARDDARASSRARRPHASRWDAVNPPGAVRR